MRRRFLTACSVVMLLAVTASAGGRGEQQPFRVQNAWARETAGIPRNAAAYLRLTSNSDTDDVLIGGYSAAAEVIEIHVHERNGDVMVMRPLHDGLAIPAGETVVLEPMGIHVMLIGLNHALEAGESFELELHFESGARVKTEVEVRPLRN